MVFGHFNMPINCRQFDCINSPANDLDFVLGFFITSLVPAADKRSLGTRYTPGLTQATEDRLAKYDEIFSEEKR